MVPRFGRAATAAGVSSNPSIAKIARPSPRRAPSSCFKSRTSKSGGGACVPPLPPPSGGEVKQAGTPRTHRPRCQLGTIEKAPLVAVSVLSAPSPPPIRLPVWSVSPHHSDWSPYHFFSLKRERRHMRGAVKITDHPVQTSLTSLFRVYPPACKWSRLAPAALREPKRARVALTPAPATWSDLIRS